MSDDVLTFVEGEVGRIRLNRPKAIHALTTAMCAQVLDALATWTNDAAVEGVLIDHAGGRGFCAGGDLRMMAEGASEGGAAARDFFRTEYRMNYRLFTYPKPIVAFMDGITLGGGVGISQPARYRVATENTRFAMPETGIGLFPDVGSCWYLSRLPGRIGAYLAVTGARLDGPECLALGLASDYLSSASLGEAKARIAAAPAEIEAILKDLAVPPPEAAILAHREAIDRLFAVERLEDILAALEADGGEWAKQQLALLASRSPQTMKVSLRLVREAARMPDFAAEMTMEYAVASRIVLRHDFAEGVRAVIIDKNHVPRWDPATPEEVSATLIDAIFAPLPEDETWTPALLPGGTR